MRMECLFCLYGRIHKANISRENRVRLRLRCALALRGKVESNNECETNKKNEVVSHKQSSYQLTSWGMYAFNMLSHTKLHLSI